MLLDSATASGGCLNPHVKKPSESHEERGHVTPTLDSGWSRLVPNVQRDAKTGRKSNPLAAPPGSALRRGRRSTRSLFSGLRGCNLITLDLPRDQIVAPALWSYLASIWSIRWADEVDFSRQQAKDRMSADGAISAEKVGGANDLLSKSVSREASV